MLQLTAYLLAHWCPTSLAQRVENLPAVQETQVQSLGQEDLLEKGSGTPMGQKVGSEL